MPINLTEFLTRVSTSKQEILTNFYANEESLIKYEGNGETSVYPITSNIGLPEENKSLLINDDSIFDVDFNITFLVLSESSERYSYYSRSMDYDFPMKRYYITFSEESPNIGTVVPFIVPGDDPLRGTVKIVDYNSGTPNVDEIIWGDDVKTLILDVWDSDTAMTEDQKSNYIKLLSKGFYDVQTT